MSNFNKILLMGNLTRDPQLSYTPSQTAVVDFGLAVNRRWTGKDGSAKEETCFVDCRAFGRMAENLNKYMSKGRPLFVEGRLTYEAWTAQDGSKRSRHRVTVENFRFLGGGGGSSAGQTSARSVESNNQQPQAVDDSSGPGPDDDIPF